LRVPPEYATISQQLNHPKQKNNPSPFNNLMIITFLGTSTSVGIPVIGCNCPTCTSTDTKNKRLRSSIHIETPTHSILVDSGPDLRQQYTHNHLDHVTGFDELRAFCWRRTEPLPLYGTEETLNSLKTMFAWAFSDTNIYKGYIRPDPIPIKAPFKLGDLTITPLPVLHGSVETIGYRFDIPEPHPTHLSISESTEIAKSINAKQTYLTHISHETNYVAEQKKLPTNITFAYDMLTIR